MSNTGKVLVLGASGFLGGNVVLALVEQGRDVRAFARKTSDRSVTQHLPIEWAYGDINDEQSLLDAMQGVETVYHCIVNTRSWLRNPAELYNTNVEGLKRALRAAEKAGVKKYIYTSSFATIGPNPSGISTEADHFAADAKIPEYVRCRAKAEQVFLDFINSHDMFGVACCVGNTYGANDTVPTPHGKMVKDAGRGQMPFYWEGGGACVGVKDAAEGMILAEHKGKSGERYIFTDRWISFKELFELSAKAGGKELNMFKMPIIGLIGIAYFSEIVTRFKGVENRLNVESIKCSTQLSNASNAKAKTELGWQPRPIEVSIKEAVDFYKAQYQKSKDAR
jgi:dihydroflavonol-4-reductase